MPCYFYGLAGLLFGFDFVGLIAVWRLWFLILVACGFLLLCLVGVFGLGLLRF